MSAPDPPKLFGLWQQERINVDQAMGYSLQNDLKRDLRIAQVEQENNDLRQAVRSLRADVDRLIAHTQLPLDQK